MSDWQAVEADARAQALAYMTADETTPLEWGQFIAWAEGRYGRTDGLSVAHRVGEPFGQAPMTICGEIVPEPISRLSLTARLIHTLGKCRYCEQGFATKGVFGI